MLTLGADTQQTTNRSFKTTTYKLQVRDTTTAAKKAELQQSYKGLRVHDTLGQNTYATDVAVKDVDEATA